MDHHTDEETPGREDGETGAEAGDETAAAEDEGRKPPPDDLESDPAYNPDGPLEDYKGG